MQWLFYHKPIFDTLADNRGPCERSTKKSLEPDETQVEACRRSRHYSLLLQKTCDNLVGLDPVLLKENKLSELKTLTLVKKC